MNELIKMFLLYHHLPFYHQEYFNTIKLPIYQRRLNDFVMGGMNWVFFTIIVDPKI